MDFKDALAWQGIDSARPVKVPGASYTWYGFLRENAGEWLFDGCQVANPGSFAKDLSIRILMWEPFGYPLMTEMDYGLTGKMQEVNPFVGTTHYPNMAYQMTNISRLKYWWILVRESARFWITIPKR